jgi:phenylalanyl-tRNA synthetase alpha chain
MNEDIENIRRIGTAAGDALAPIDNIKDLDAWNVQWLGRNSELTQKLRSISTISSIEERKAVGAASNQIRNQLESASAEKRAALREVQISSAAAQESVDITLPGRPYAAGRIHPISETIDEMCEIFISMGFQVREGPDVEWDYYNFEALNIPAEHPARDDMSSFWIDVPAREKGRQLLRTHTTAVTARTLEDNKPPIRIIEPGRCHRYEATDATHIPVFYQIDGIGVDKGITMADLKGTLYEFSRRFFGADRKVRFRVDYFPFVEPGVEMAIECVVCKGSGCRLCKNSGWLEILGAGMTHPDVLRRAGIDPEEYTSFAFGIGVERLHMLRYGVDNVRLYFYSDLRFLRQF